MKRGTHRVEFGPYELALLRKLRRELAAQYRARGKKPPSVSDVIRGAFRTGVHSVYGEDYVYTELLSEERLMELATGSEIDSSQFDLESEG